MKMTRAIGDVFKILDIKLEVVEQQSCEGCNFDFFEHACGIPSKLQEITGSCYYNARTDAKSIIFKKLNKGNRKMINNPKRHRIETRGWCAKVHRQLEEYLQKVGNYNTLMPLVDFIGTAGEKYIINVSEGFDGKLDFYFVKYFPATDNEWKEPLMARLNLPISIIKNIVRAFEQEEKDGNC